MTERGSGADEGYALARALVAAVERHRAQRVGVDPVEAPAKGRVSTKGRRFPPEVLTPEEVRRLIGAASATAPTGIRNRALLAVLYRGGLRLGEALALYPKDVDVARGTMPVLHGKGDRSRVVGIDPGALALVERWLEVRRRRGLSTRRPPSAPLHGERLAPSYVRHLHPA